MPSSKGKYQSIVGVVYCFYCKMDEATKQLHDQLPKELKDVFFGSKKQETTKQDPTKEETRQEAMQRTLEKIKAINKSPK